MFYGIVHTLCVRACFACLFFPLRTALFLPLLLDIIVNSPPAEIYWFICWQFLKGNTPMDMSASFALDACTHMLAVVPDPGAVMWHSVLHST